MYSLLTIKIRQAGFTLLEMLVVIFITAIVLAAVYSTFFTTNRAISATGDTLLSLHEARAALDIMRREVESAFTHDKTASFVVRDRDHYGRKTSEISFATHGSVIKGPSVISYYVDEIDEKIVLKKRLSRIGQEHEDGAEVDAVENISSFLVEVKNSGEWTSTYNSKKLPKQVRLTLGIVLEDRVLMLSVTAAPRMKGKV